MRYVTYDENGQLMGAFMQDLQPGDAGHYIEVLDDAVYRNWLGYQANAARDGLELLPALPAPKIIPDRVTRRQARQALLLAGKLSAVQPAIDAIADPIQRGLAQIEWDDSQDFERKRPLLVAIGTAIGLGSDDLDALFVQAAAL